MELITNLVFSLLVWAVFDQTSPGESIFCDPGTFIQKRQDGEVCVPCPPRTFSKRNNSVCLDCQKCYRDRVKANCTAVEDTICQYIGESETVTSADSESSPTTTKLDLQKNTSLTMRTGGKEESETVTSAGSESSPTTTKLDLQKNTSLMMRTGAHLNLGGKEAHQWNLKLFMIFIMFCILSPLFIYCIIKCYQCIAMKQNKNYILKSMMNRDDTEEAKLLQKNAPQRKANREHTCSKLNQANNSPPTSMSRNTHHLHTVELSYQAPVYSNYLKLTCNCDAEADENKRLLVDGANKVFIATKNERLLNYSSNCTRETLNFIDDLSETCSGDVMVEVNTQSNLDNDCNGDGNLDIPQERRVGSVKPDIADYSKSEYLNNWDCHSVNVSTTESYTENDNKLESEGKKCLRVLVVTSGDMSECESGSVSSSSATLGQSSDELTSSDPSNPSLNLEPVTYIHNTYQVKDCNLIANTQRETQASEIEAGSTPEEESYDLSTSDDFYDEVESDAETCICAYDNSDSSQEDSQQSVQSSQNVQSFQTSLNDFNTMAWGSMFSDTMNITAYMKNQDCKPENLHENVYKNEGTQTRFNNESMSTLFGQKWDIKKYVSSEGGQLTKPTTNMSLQIFPYCIPEKETVQVGGRFTGNHLDVLKYIDEGWVVTSPLAEFQMTHRKRWDKHVKIYIPYYPNNPKEMMKVFYYHRTPEGDIEKGDVPLHDDSRNQDMYYVKTADHVEIYTMTFTLFHCACDHKFPLFMTSLVFTSYNKDKNEAVVRLHVGSKLLSDPLNKNELQEDELKQHRTTLKATTDVRLLEKFNSDSRLVFKIDFPPNNGTTTNHGIDWRNVIPQAFPQQQERRFRELVSCTSTPPVEVSLTHNASCGTAQHRCQAEIQWRYMYDLTNGPPPDRFLSTISISHELPPGQEADRHGACQEGITWIWCETEHAGLHSLAKSSSREAETGHRDLPSDVNKYGDPYSCFHGISDTSTKDSP